MQTVVTGVRVAQALDLHRAEGRLQVALVQAPLRALDIVRRIEAGEVRHTEFKRGPGDLSAVGRSMCAFGNAEAA